MIPDYGLRPLSGLRVECSCVNFNVEFGERSRITACGLYPGYGWNVPALISISNAVNDPGLRPAAFIRATAGMFLRFINVARMKCNEIREKG